MSLFGKRSSGKCGGCGRTIETIEEASKDFGWQFLAAQGNPLTEMQAKMDRMSKVLGTPAYVCRKCGATTCRGCSRTDSSCAKCGSTDTTLAY